MLLEPREGCGVAGRGCLVGTSTLDSVGSSVGVIGAVGETVGKTVGFSLVGEVVGNTVGTARVGELVTDGVPDGTIVGDELGRAVVDGRILGDVDDVGCWLWLGVDEGLTVWDG